MSRSSEPPKAVVFDADGVLQRRRPGFVRGLLRLGGWRFTIDCLRAEAGTLTDERDLVEVLDEVVARHQVATTGEEVMRRWLHIEVDPGALEIVRELRRRGVTVALGTNQQSYRGAHMRDVVGYPDEFDASFYSHQLRLAKPDPAYFRAVADGLGLEPGEILFIDDLPGNVRGARSIGMRAEQHLWVTRARGLRRILRRHGLG